jgi:hypothetical protein
MKKTLSILGVLIAASLTAQAIPVTEVGIGANQIVTISGTGLGTVSVYAGVLKLNVNGTVVDGFCIDPFQWSSSSQQTYSESALSSLQNNTSPTLDAAKALTIGKMWNLLYSPTISNENAALLQLSIWTVVAGTPPFVYTGSSSSTSDISNFIALANSQNVTANLTRLSNDTYQDYIIASPGAGTFTTTVPDTGSTVLMLGFALGTLVVISRGRRLA